MATLGRLVVDLVAETSQFHASMERSAAQTQNFFKSIDSHAKNSMAVVNQAKTALMGFISLFGAKLALDAFIGANVEIGKLRAQLKSAEGSMEAASFKFSELSQFAYDTGQRTSEVTQAYIKLKNLGLEPTTSALESYGNTAAAMGKSTMDFVEAVADATTNEFERLKEFGIKARQEGENVTFTFQGVSTTIKKNAEDISQYLINIGNVQFAGLLRDQAEALSGVITRLQASITSLWVKIGDVGATSLMISAITSLTGVIAGLTDIIPDLVSMWSIAFKTMDSQTQQSFTLISSYLNSFLSSAQQSINTSWTQIVLTIPNTLAAIAVTVGSVIGGILVIMDSGWVQIQNITKIAWNNIDIFVTSAVAVLEEAIVNGFRSIFSGLGSVIQNAGAELQGFAYTADSVSETLARSISDTAIGMQKFGSSMSSVEPHVSSLRESTASLNMENEKLYAANIRLSQVATESISSIRENVDAQWDLVASLQSNLSIIESVDRASTDLSNSVDNLNSQIKDETNALESNSKSSENNAKSKGAVKKATDDSLKALDQYIKSMTDEYAQLTLTERQYEDYKLIQQGVSDEYREIALAIYDKVQAEKDSIEATKRATEETSKALEEQERAYEQLGDSIQTNLSDTFYNIFTDGLDSLSNLFDQVKKLFFKMLADMIAAGLRNPIMLSITSNGLSGAGIQSATGQGGFGYSSLLSGAGSLLGGVGGGLGLGFSSSAAAFADFGLFGGIGASFGNAASFMAAGQTLAAAGAFLSAALPIIGAVIAIVSLFGKESVPKATAKIELDPETLSSSILQESGKHGATPGPLMEALDSFQDYYLEAIDTLDLGMEALIIEFHQRKDKFHALVGPIDDPTAFFTEDVDISDTAAVSDAINKTLLAAIAQSDTSEASEAIAAFLESIQLDAIKAMPEGQAQEVLSWLFSIGDEADKAAKSLPYLAEAIKSVGNSGRSVDELVVFTSSLIAIGSALDTTPFEDYQSALENASKSMLTQLQEAQTGIIDMLSDFKGTAGETEALALAVVSYKNAAAEAARIIAEMSAAIDSAVSSSVERIRLENMSDEERGAYFLQQAEEMRLALEAATDPEQISHLFAEFQRYTELAFGTLTEEQKKLQQDVFISMLEEGGDIANSRLENATDILSAQFAEMSNAVTIGMLQAFEEAGLITEGAAAEFLQQILDASEEASNDLEKSGGSLSDDLSEVAQEMGNVAEAAEDAALELITAALKIKDAIPDKIEISTENGFTPNSNSPTLFKSQSIVPETPTFTSTTFATSSEESSSLEDYQKVLTDLRTRLNELTGLGVLNAVQELSSWFDETSLIIQQFGGDIDKVKVVLKEEFKDLVSVLSLEDLNVLSSMIPELAQSLGLSVDYLVNEIKEAKELIAINLLGDIQRRFNELSGAQIVNDIRDLVSWYNDTAGQLEDLGLEKDLLKDTFDLEINNLIGDLSLEELQNLIDLFPELTDIIGVSIDDLLNSTLEARDKLKKQLQDNIGNRINDLTGMGSINLINDLLVWYSDTINQAELLGISLERIESLFDLELGSILEGLDLSQLEKLIEIFPQLSDSIQKAIDSLNDSNQSLIDDFLKGIGDEISSYDTPKPLQDVNSLLDYIRDLRIQAEELGVETTLIDELFSTRFNDLLSGLNLADLQLLMDNFPEFAEVIQNAIDSLNKSLASEAIKELTEKLRSDIENSFRNLMDWYKDISLLDVDTDLLNEGFLVDFKSMIDGLDLKGLEDLLLLIDEFGDTLGDLSETIRELVEDQIELLERQLKEQNAIDALDVLIESVERQKQILRDQYEEAKDLAESEYEEAITRIRLSYQQQKEALEERQKEEQDYLKQGIGAIEESIKSLSSLLNSLTQAVDTLRDPSIDRGIQEQSLAEARAQLTVSTLLAKNGILPDGDDILKTISTIANADTSLFSNREDYLRTRLIAANQTESLVSSVGNRLTLEQKTLMALEEQLNDLLDLQNDQINQLELELEAAEKSAESLMDELDEWYNDQIEALDQLVEDSQEQLNTLLGIEGGILSVSEALEKLSSTLLILREDTLNVNSKQIKLDTEQMNLSAHVNELKNELNTQRVEMNRLQSSVIQYTEKTARALDRWDKDGLPDTRVI